MTVLMARVALHVNFIRTFSGTNRALERIDEIYLVEMGPYPQVHTINVVNFIMRTLRFGKEKIAVLGSVQCFL